MKKFTTWIVIISSVILLFFGGYCLYIWYQFEKNPLFYYRPRTIEHANP